MQSLDNHDRTIMAIEELIEDADFESLNQRLAERTLFDVLGISEDELSHSKMMAWLLDPTESHGLGSKALRRFLYRAAKLAHAAKVDFGKDGVPFTPLLAETLSFADVHLRCEYSLLNRRRPDLVIWSEDERWLCVIENKILSDEGEEQTTSYYNEMLRSFPPDQFRHRLFIYLTPEGTWPESRKFVPVSYSTVACVLAKARDAAAGFGRVAIEQYANCLGGRILERDQLQEICWKLCRNHRVAIDAILDYGDVNMLAAKTRERVLEELRRRDGSVIPGRNLEWESSKGIDWIAIWPRNWPIKMRSLKYPGFFKIWWKDEPQGLSETIKVELGFDRPNGPAVRAHVEELMRAKSIEVPTSASVTAKDPADLSRAANEASKCMVSLVENSFSFLEKALRQEFPDQWGELPNA